MADDTLPASLAPSIDPDLVNAVKRFEGFAPKAQWDYSQYSVGYGTRGRPGETIDEATAHDRLMSELAHAQSQVDALGVPLTPGQRNALTSLTYNAGPSWMKSGLGDAVRNGDWNRVRGLFLTYNKAGGDALPGLTARRQAEAAWLTGDMPSYASATGGGGGVQARVPASDVAGAATPQQPATDDAAAALMTAQSRNDMLEPQAALAPLSFPQNALRLRNALASRMGQANSAALPPSVAQRLAALIGKA